MYSVLFDRFPAHDLLMSKPFDIYKDVIGYRDTDKQIQKMDSIVKSQIQNNSANRFLYYT